MGGDEDFRKERYEHNVNMCLNEYPDRVFGKTNNIFKVISTILRKRLRLMFDDFDVNEETMNGPTSQMLKLFLVDFMI